jgi:hypothetical protein
MAQGQLDYIINAANELKGKLGNAEKNIPGWIQDHISKAHSYIHQSNSGYHEYGTGINEGIIQDRENELKRLSKGATVSGGGYGPFIKIGSDTFKNKKNGTLYHSAALASHIGTFKDFKINENVNEGKLQFKNLKKGDILVGKFPPYKEMEVISSTDKSAKVKSSRGGVVDIYSTNNYELKENSIKLSKLVETIKEVTTKTFKFPKSITTSKFDEIDAELFRAGITTHPNFNTNTIKVSGDIKKAMKIISRYKGIEEVIKENTEPEIITQLRDVMKSGYKTLKDPKSGKKMKVDSYSASAIVKVYDALKDPKNKEKFSSMGLLGMQSTAFKLIK